MAKRNRIVFQKVNENNEWENYLSARAEITGISGKDYHALGVEQATTIKNFRVCYAKSLAQLMPQEVRIVYGGLTYVISTIDDFKERHKELVFRAEARYGR